jgi:hypothetical protein
MKQFALLSILLLLWGCKAEETTTDIDSHIRFSEDSLILGVVDDEEWFEIPIEATATSTHDRNIGVEVIAAESSAIEDYHFTMESHTVTIKAGERFTSLRVKGHTEALAPNQKVEIKLNLILDEESIADEQSTEATVTLTRCCPFDINNFEGYAVVTSTWAMQYMNMESRLVHTRVDEKEDGVIVIEDMFYEGYDIRVKLDSDDRLNPLAELCGAQVLSSTGEAFGTIYGNGKLMVGETLNNSYYSTCENFLLLYTEMYVEEVGTVGEYANVFEWVSDDEAERIMREGF